MTIPTISTLPVAPARTDAPATFVTRADAFLAALVVMQGELNTSIGAMNTDIAQANADAISAAASEVAAAGSAAAAAATAGATYWVSGQAYDSGDVAVSLIDNQTYRANTSTSGTTDPSASADWTQISYALPVQTGNSGKYLTTDGSDASWGVVEALPDQSGNAGNYLTTDGTDASWAALEVGTATMTASGSITAGDPVALNDDGTVSKISFVDSLEPGCLLANQAGNDTTFTFTGSEVGDRTAPPRGTASVSYGGGYITHYTIETVGSVSSGTYYWQPILRLYKLNEEGVLEQLDVKGEGIVTPNSQDYLCYGADVSSDGRFVVAGAGGGGSNTGYNFFVVYEIVHGKLVFRKRTGTQYVTEIPKFSRTGYNFVLVGNGSSRFVTYVNATTWNVGSPISHPNNFASVYGFSNYQIEKAVGEDKVVIAFHDSANSNRPSAVIFNFATQSFGAVLVLNTSFGDNGANIAMVRANPAYSFYVAYRVSNNSRSALHHIYISGNNLGAYGPYEVPANSVDGGRTLMLHYHPLTNRMTYVFGNINGQNIYIYSVPASLQSAPIQQYSGAGIFGFGSLYSATGGFGFSGIENTDISLSSGFDGRIGLQAFNSRQPDTTNFENYIGYAAESITSGSSGSIRLLGQVQEKSGLTAGKTYYFDNLGNLTEDRRYVNLRQKAGRAISSTKLFLEK